MLRIDLTGKRALVAGVADDNGFGFAIAKALAEAGASVVIGTWPPALKIFLNLIERGKMDESRRMSDGSLLQFEKIYPLDAAFDTLEDAPPDVRENKRYSERGDFSVSGMVKRLTDDFGAQPLDIVMHSLANGPEVRKPLMETSRAGYLSAISVSAYSLVSMVSRLGPLMRPDEMQADGTNQRAIALERDGPGCRLVVGPFVGMGADPPRGMVERVGVGNEERGRGDFAGTGEGSDRWGIGRRERAEQESRGFEDRLGAHGHPWKNAAM